VTFWSGERLDSELPALITPYNKSQIDCAAYRLRLGSQVFVTSDEILGGEPLKGLRTYLGRNKAPFPLSISGSNSVRIPPGQFGFLLTEEEVKVPGNALAWISIRTTYKFRGLINVSGFHVDPGWCGKLIFSVYNAGPAPVHLTRGEDLFLILYSDLGRDKSEVPCSTGDYAYHGGRGRQASIPSDLISNMAGQVFSPMYLEREMRELKNKFIRLEVIGTALLSVVLSALAYYFWKQPETSKQSQPPTIVNNYPTPAPSPSVSGEKKGTPQKKQ
jgi:dCTP deaminase